MSLAALVNAASGSDAAARAARQAEVVAALRPLLPAHALLWRGEDTTPYECDGLTAYREQPLVVALPETEDQVAAVLRCCHALAVPVVARGAGTGLSGGALPHRLGVTLSLAKFNRIVRIDALARTAVVQCGVRNLAISEAAAPLGLYYAPDPSSQIACTIGGNVAENAGGVHCLKYGLTVHNVLAVRGFTAQGEPVAFGSAALDSAGLDLLAAVIGSEGMLAVVTEVTVKLVPRPPTARCIMASFDDVRKAGNAVAEVIAAGIVPAGLEMMDQPMVAAVEDFVHAGYDLQAAAILLCESDGTAEEVGEEIERLLAVLGAAGATRLEVSRDEAQRLRFWSGRKNAFPASGRISPDYLCMDSTIPRKRLADILQAIQAMEHKYRLRCVNVFHAGDGNLHPLILYDASDPEQLRRCEAFGADILQTSVALGGTITGEHGVGIEKLGSMAVQFSAAELAQMTALKHAFDPQGLLNPGKVIPLPQQCAEGGRRPLRRGLLAAAEPAGAVGEGAEASVVASLAAASAPAAASKTLSALPALQCLVEQVRQARSERRMLSIRGGATKAFYGEAAQGQPLDMRALTGIVAYEPSELVVSVLAGTPLAELEALLAAHGQGLAFEPPRFAPGGTVGGMVAAGLAGPARAAAGAVRDAMLGATVLNGRAELLAFGGQVMKNVAGYDVARLLAGSLGQLGAICEVSLKVQPLAAARATLRFELGEAAAIEQLNRWGGQALPLNASAWWDGCLLLRLAGAQAAVRAACATLGGERIDAGPADAFWAGLRDQTDEFFSAAQAAVAHGAALWRLSLPPTTPPLGLSGEQLIEWGGAQRWLCSSTPAAMLRAQTLAAGGHATLFRALDRAGGVFTPLPPALARIHRALKTAFDPDRVFDAGRLYPGL